eukprot:m.16638 g.16638  ORF g.16638 m.16638 type:complete len:346 (-) comp3520_c0_seq1:35-1072(-)
MRALLCALSLVRLGAASSACAARPSATAAVSATAAAHRALTTSSPTAAMADDSITRVSEIPKPPERPAGSHKGTYGTVVVVGGSHTMIGAPAISATAALRTGTGLCKIMTDRALIPSVLTVQPSATGLCFEDTVEDTLAALGEPSRKQVLAIGPGLGATEGFRRDLVARILDSPYPAVLDADGLNILAASGRSLNTTRKADWHPLVLTPHPGEFRRLAESCGIKHSPTDHDERILAATELARAHSAVVVLKGDKTVVADGERYFVNPTGNPALSTAGSGDVLTGIIASLLAQGLSGFDAAVLGVNAHGMAADRWAIDEQHGFSGLLAMDLCHQLPHVFRVLRGRL